jgi:protein-disulfide isomerase
MRKPWLALLVACALPAVSRAQEKNKTCGDCSMPSLSSTPSPTPAREAPGAKSRGEDLQSLDAETDRRMLAGDRTGLAELLDDAMVSVSEDGRITPREKFLERVRPPRASSNVAVTPSEVSVRMFGDTALVTSKKTRSWTMNGETNSMSYHQVDTWVRRDGAWRLAVALSTYDPPPYAAADVSFDLPFDSSLALGAKNPTLVLYEFSDYECPFCRTFAHETLSRVEQEYVRTGKVALVYRDNPLDMHPRAMPAALASRCAAAQGKLWAMNAKLLEDPVALSDEDLARRGREIGLDSAAFDRCRQDPETADAIRREMKEARTHGVKGTPMFAVAVRKPGQTTAHAIRLIEGAQPYEVFQKTLDGLLRARG